MHAHAHVLLFLVHAHVLFHVDDLGFAKVSFHNNIDSFGERKREREITIYKLIFIFISELP